MAGRAWDVTVTWSTLADSYIHQSATTAKAAAELAAARKVSKYADPPSYCMFQSAALETMGPINESAIQLIENLGRKISAISNETRESLFLFQRLSVLVQRFIAILLVRNSFCTKTHRTSGHPSSFQRLV